MTERPVRRVVVFDLDDTLYLERDYVSSGLRAVGRWVADNLGCAEFEACAARHFAAGVRGTVFDAALRELRLDGDKTLIARLVEVYRNHAPEIRLASDAVTFLDQRAADAGVALLTDGFLCAQENKIRALGLAELSIRPLVCTDRWGREYWKPHEHGFLQIQQHFGLEPGAFTYVADNPSKDFIAPRRLGWHTVQIRRPERLHANVGPAPEGEAAESIQSLEELLVAPGWA